MSFLGVFAGFIGVLNGLEVVTGEFRGSLGVD